MRYVLDSSAGFKWAVIEHLTDKARQLRDDFLAGLLELLAPDVFPIELAHALPRAERQGRVTRPQGSRLMIDLLTMLPQLVSSLSLLPRAYAISSGMRVGVYDCLYVALAEREGCESFMPADAPAGIKPGGS